jgi:lipopolysaccharide export system protein LptA
MSPAPRSRRFALTAIAAVLAFASSAGAQAQQQCDLVFPNTPGTRMQIVTTPTGERNSFIGAGVVAYCAGQDNRLVSDSAEYYEGPGLLYLIGNVHYTEPRAAVDAARMTYYQHEDRLTAEGNVLVTFSNGSTMRGPSADYWRVTPTRPVEQLIATGRPELQLVERDAAGREAPPVIVHADRIQMNGDSLVYASGRVNIARTDITASADTAFMDGRREFVRLMRSPRIVGRGERPYTLEGEVIEIFSRARQVERVVATPRGYATSQDLELFADSIDLRMSGERIERLFAWGASRARATSPERDIIADSLAVTFAGEQIEEVHAVGDAFATSIPDTAQVISHERDWLQGDTIVARFDTAAAPAGTADGRTQARELLAIGEARSYHQVAGQGGIRDRPNVNYVRGDRIVVALTVGEVDRVTVTGNASGVYLEVPQPPSEPAAAPASPQPPPAPPAPPVP